eukprot:SAG22_NODE_17563_length_302_cov_1.709360_1_plen_55_part_01
MKAHPTVETVQKNNICHSVVAPARVSAEICKAAQELCMKAVDCLPGASVRPSVRP